MPELMLFGGKKILTKNKNKSKGKKYRKNKSKLVKKRQSKNKTYKKRNK